MKKTNNFLALFFSLLISINLIGCCSHSGGDSNSNNGMTPVAQKTFEVKSDGPVNFELEGVKLSAASKTFAKGTKITLLKYEDSPALKEMNLKDKGVSLLSPVFGFKLEPEQDILDGMATISVDITPGITTGSKTYFALKRDEVSLVSSEEETSGTPSYRASATSNKKHLPFITTFKYIALTSIKDEFLASDPVLLSDSNSNTIFQEQYSPAITLFTKIKTKDKDEFEKGAKLRLKFRTDKTSDTDIKKLENLSHCGSPIEISKIASAYKKIVQGSIDLTNIQIEKLDKFSKFSAFLQANKGTLPSRVILESEFTNNRNLPIASKETVIYFAGARHPYPQNVWPASGSSIVNKNQLESIVVNFSEPMDKSSVENAATLSVGNQLYTSKDPAHKLSFSWGNNDKQLSIKGFTLPDAIATISVFISKTAKGTTNEQIAMSSNSRIPEDCSWSFNYSPAVGAFYVIMTDPKPGSTNVSLNNDVTLVFSEECSPANIDDYIKLYQETTPIDDRTLELQSDRKTLKVKSKLNYSKEYKIVVSKEMKNSKYNKNLSIDYTTSFMTVNSFSAGSGLESDPYIITNEDDLKKINDPEFINSGKYFKMNKDIKICTDNKSWISLGTDATPFKGHFDGNNKKITNLYINKQSNSKVALFGCVSSSEIKNLVLDEPKVTSKKQTGALVGLCINSKISNITVNNPSLNVAEGKAGCIAGSVVTSTIENCKVNINSGSVFEGHGNELGGIAGIIRFYSKISSSSVTLNNGAYINAGDYTGGIVGHSLNSTIEKATFSGKIGNSENSNSIGGIVGAASHSEIEYCCSEGVGTTDGSVSGNDNIGGICGLLTDHSEIDNSVTSMNVEGSENIGGIAGKVKDSEIEDSYVTSKSVKSNTYNCGGIAGYVENSTLQDLVIRANIEAKYNVGGVAGQAQNSTIQKTAVLSNQIKMLSEKLAVNLIAGSNINSTLIQNFGLKGIKFFYNNSNKDEEFTPENLDGTLAESETVIKESLQLDTKDWIKNPF